MTTTHPAPSPSRTAGPEVPSAVVHVGSVADAETLAAHLQDPARAWPVVVVSTPRERGRPYLDPARVLDDVRGLAEVVVLPTGEVSWAFSHHMPGGTQVYGGASRVYPVGVEWVHDLSRSHLWFAYDDAEGTRVHDRLVEDALTAATAAGLTGASQTGAAPTTSGTVLGIVGTRALVQTADGTTAQVAQELTLPIVPIDRLLVAGLRVHGVLDPTTNRLDVRGMLPDSATQAARVRAAYRVGAVVPAQVHGVGRDAVHLALAPAVTVRVGREHATGGDADDLRDLFSIGEVVAARMLAGHPVPGPAGGLVQPDLRLDDVDDGPGAVDVLPAISLLDGGPPWLSAPEAVGPDSAASASADSADSTEPADLPFEPMETASGPAGRPSAPPPRPTPALLARRPDEPPAPAAAGMPAAQATPAKPAAPAAPKPGPGPRPAVPPPGHDTPPEAPPSTGPARPGEPSTRRALVNQLELSVHEHRTRADVAEREVVELRAALRNAEIEVAGLRDLTREQRERISRLHQDVERYKTRIRVVKKERRAPPDGPAAGPRPLFSDPVDQLRFDVRCTWAEVIGAEEKPSYPLPEFDVGPRFCASLADVGRGLEDKVHRAIVMVLTGRAQDVAGYELHRLRRGDGGGDPYRVRETDGAQAWRLSLQVSSPQARRLHYWVLPGGRVELSRVVLHDDVEP